MLINFHQPVLLSASIEGLSIHPKGIYVDATFGGGGHTKAILQHLDGGKMYSFDQDEAAADIARTIKHPAFCFIRANVRFIKRFLAYHQVEQVDGILADLGVSSYQIDTSDRGFSTRLSGPLDMRMDQMNPLTAYHVVNTYHFEALVSILKSYGELRNASAIAKAILTAREQGAIQTTEALKAILLPFTRKHKSAQFLAQVFQAFRIEVNDELNALKEFLEQTKNVLKPGGRLVVLSYHSLEDRMAKRMIKVGNFSGELEKDAIYGHAIKPFCAINKKPIMASQEELALNPRARSAKLRIGERLKDI